MPRGFLSLPEVFFGSLVPFRTHLVGLLTFYLGEQCHYFLLFFCLFSCFNLCVSRSLIHKQYLSGGGGASCLGGRPFLGCRGRSPGGADPRSSALEVLCLVSCPTWDHLFGGLHWQRKKSACPAPSEPLWLNGV